MNVTLLGKILVFVNLTAALVFAGWAVGVATNRIDYTGTGAPAVAGGTAQGELAQRKALVQDREKAAGLALARWQANTATLLDLEKQRPAAQSWYDDKLSILEKGTNKAGQPGALTALVYNNGRLQVGQEGNPLLGPDKQPLQSRVALNLLLKNTEDEIQKQIQLAETAIKQAEALTVEINGLPDKQKGLRDLIREEETAQLNAVNELAYLRPFRYNRQAEAELLQERRAQMEARINELKKIALAK
jgi:hypothetical protein